MFGDKDRSLKIVDHSPSTLLDRGCRFEGKLTFEGTVQINGNFRGEIFSDGTLIIGEGANVEGKLEVENAIISGQVMGTIVAKQKIEMHPPSLVRGDITAPALVIEEGSLFEGNCSMGIRKQQETAEVVNGAFEFNLEQ